MKIFITGALGYIGFEVAKAFVRNGHDVFGLTRRESGAKLLQEQEITPVIGTLEKLPQIETDVIVHCAYESIEKDANAVDLLLNLKHKTFLYTSGVWVYGNQTGPVDERTPLQPLENVKGRPETEKKVLQSSSNSIIIRPGHVYGFGKGLFAMLFENLTVVGNGDNFWTTVHVTDLADLYVLAVQKELNQTILNGVSDSISMKELASGIAKLNNQKPNFISLEDALQKLGPFAYGLAVNQPDISSEKALSLGWHPKHPPLLTKLKHYFNTWKASI